MAQKLFLITVIFMAIGCAPTRVVVPLEKGEHQAGLSFGGPLIDFQDMTIPIPLTTASYIRGINDNYTVTGGLHITSLLYGVIQNDFGIVRHVVKPGNSPIGISGGIYGNTMIGLREGDFRFYPQVDLNAYLPLKNYNFVYTGVSTWFELVGIGAHDENKGNALIPNMFIGITIRRPKFQYALEAKYINPFVSNKDIVVDYKLSGNTGALGLYLSVNKILK